MTYALDHTESAQELVNAIWQNMHREKEPVHIIPRIYLISDILYNCAITSSVPNGWAFRTYFESLLPEMFEFLNHLLR
jgi:hypothetical protein